MIIALYFLSTLNSHEKSKHNYLCCCCWKLMSVSLQVCPTSNKSWAHIVGKNPFKNILQRQIAKLTNIINHFEKHEITIAQSNLNQNYCCSIPCRKFNFVSSQPKGKFRGLILPFISLPYFNSSI